MVILHIETCKIKKKISKNYLHIYLTIHLNRILIEVYLAESTQHALLHIQHPQFLRTQSSA